MRKQQGQIIRIGDRWYVRYWERRNIGGKIERKRVTYLLGDVTTRGKRPPADIVTEAERHMATVNNGALPAERIVTVGDFVSQVYLLWIAQHKSPSTEKGYRDIWEDHLQPRVGKLWLKDVRTYHAQQWLNDIGKDGKLSRNTLRHIKSVISAIFRLAKQQDYFQGENPARDTAINPAAAEAHETYAYTLDEVQSILVHLPEPAATAFAVAAYMGLRHGEIQGLLWENYRGRRDTHHTVNLEWPGRSAENSERTGACTGDSAVGRTTGDASPAFWQSAVWASFQECQWQVAVASQRRKPSHSAESESLRNLPQAERYMRPENCSRIQAGRCDS